MKSILDRERQDKSKVGEKGGYGSIKETMAMYLDVSNISFQNTQFCSKRYNDKHTR